jgi:peptidoglycan/xylan/chitin deacetylase (PgdA/CDA1 family)
MKKLLFSVLRGAGVTRLAAWLHRDRTLFLCYHSVTKWPRLTPQELKLHTPVALFVKHLDYLQRRYRVIPLDEYLAARASGRSLPNYTAVLTFDDGMRNFLTVVAPLLEERRLAATAFVITEKANERGDSLFDREWTALDGHLHLSWSEIRALARTPGIQIGSHSRTHRDLTTVSDEEALIELRDSLAAVAEHTGNARPALAYPHGRASEQVREMAASLGYTCALTGELGANDMESDLYDLRRVVIAGDDDVATFAARVSGLTWLYDRLRAAFRRVKSSASKVGAREPRSLKPSAHEESRFVQMKKPSSETIP